MGCGAWILGVCWLSKDKVEDFTCSQNRKDNKQAIFVVHHAYSHNTEGGVGLNYSHWLLMPSSLQSADLPELVPLAEFTNKTLLTYSSLQCTDYKTTSTSCLFDHSNLSLR